MIRKNNTFKHLIFSFLLVLLSSLCLSQTYDRLQHTCDRMQRRIQANADAANPDDRDYVIDMFLFHSNCEEQQVVAKSKSKEDPVTRAINDYLAELQLYGLNAYVLFATPADEYDPNFAKNVFDCVPDLDMLISIDLLRDIENNFATSADKAFSLNLRTNYNSQYDMLLYRLNNVFENYGMAGDFQFNFDYRNYRKLTEKALGAIRDGYNLSPVTIPYNATTKNVIDSYIDAGSDEFVQIIYNNNPDYDNLVNDLKNIGYTNIDAEPLINRPIAITNKTRAMQVFEAIPDSLQYYFDDENNMVTVSDEQLFDMFQESVIGFLHQTCYLAKNMFSDAGDRISNAMDMVNSYSDLMLEGLAQAKVPDGVWNPASDDYEKYDFILLRELNSSITLSYTCGCIDGAIEEIAGVVQLFLVIEKFVYDRDFSSKFIDNISQLSWEDITREFDDVMQNKETISYTSGKTVVTVAAFFCGIGELAAFMKMNKPLFVTKTGKIIDAADIVRGFSKKVDDVMLARLKNVLKKINKESLGQMSEEGYKKFLDDVVNPGIADDIIHKIADENLLNAYDDLFLAAKRANPVIPDPGKLLRNDLSSLRAFSKFDAQLKNKIGNTLYDNFTEKLIKANPKCKTCGNLGDPLVGELDNVMDDLYIVVTEKALKGNGDFVDGFTAFMQEAGEQASKAKGAALTLKKLSRNWDEITEGGWHLERFEGTIPDIETGHRLDALLKRENPTTGLDEFKSLEMKNWEAARSISGKIYSQFKAYITSGNKFKYYFSEGLTDAMKGNFQNVFKDISKAQEFWDANPSFFENFGFPDVEALTGAANAGQLVYHPILNFIK